MNAHTRIKAHWQTAVESKIYVTNYTLWLVARVRVWKTQSARNLFFLLYSYIHTLSRVCMYVSNEKRAKELNGSMTVCDMVCDVFFVFHNSHRIAPSGQELRSYKWTWLQFFYGKSVKTTLKHLKNEKKYLKLQTNKKDGICI